MVWAEKYLKDDLIPNPCHGQEHLPLNQVAPRPVQPFLGHFQGGCTHSSFGQIYPCYAEEFRVPKQRACITFT